MIIDPFKTTVTKPYKADVIRNGIVQAALADRPASSIFRIVEGHQEVPTFTQPMAYQTPANREQCIAIDCRQYKGSNSFVMEQLELLELRAALTLHGIREESLTAFYHPVAQIAYANIVTGIISQRFGIDPKLKLQIMVVAAAHYYNITHDLGEAGYSDMELPMLMQTIIRNFKLPLDIVESTLDKIQYGDTLEAFCENVKRVDGTDRTASFSHGLLLNSATGLWFGINSNETVHVSLEHAPTFCALLFCALGDGSYSRGELAKRLKYVTPVRQKAETFRKVIRTISTEIQNA